MTTAQTAFDLASGGFHVFPLRADGTPATKNGFKDATNDPYAVQDAFEKRDNYLIGIATGPSNLIVLDIDYKESPDGTVKDGFTTIEREWLDVPESFAYTSKGGKGRHIWYRVPDEQEYGRSMTYRGLAGVDRASGDGYVVFNGDTVPKYDDLTVAPEWLCDVKKTQRVSETFKGTVKEWFETLEPGAPNALVRKAMERVNQKFSDLGNDFSHGDIVEFQYEAVRLGAEGNSGVPELLELLEEKFASRTGAHSRPEDEWAAEFNEALESGIRRAGDAIELRKTLPAYNLATIPDTVPDSMVSGEGGTPQDVTSLIRTLARTDMDDLQALSTVWNAPKTRDVARDWGLEFVHKRITEEKSRVETPSQVIPVSDTPEVAKSKQETVTLLTDKERERADGQTTFLDRYRENVLESMGFVKDEYTNPLSWTILSMAIGRSVVIPINSGLGTNLWFTVLGYSGTGKTSQFEFAQEILDGLLRGHETYWGTGIGSPEGIIESLVQRDGLPSALFEDEGAAWYKDLATKDWMRSLSNQMAKWYNGRATAPQKVRLKELRGKVSDISFNYFTISTPDETLRVIDSEMFASGFMARVAWVYGPEPVEDDERFTTSRTDLNDQGKAIQVSQLTYEMSLFRRSFPGDQRVQVYASEPVKKRLDKAWRDMQRKGKKHPKFAEIIEPSVQRLRETLWKCGAILASYRGSDEIDMDDALVALKNVEVWFSTLFQVSEEVSGAYLRDARQMSDHIRKQGGRIGRRALVKAFGHLITRSQAELADRINYLVDSGQLRAVSDNGQSYYELVE